MRNQRGDVVKHTCVLGNFDAHVLTPAPGLPYFVYAALPPVCLLQVMAYFESWHTRLVCVTGVQRIVSGSQADLLLPHMHRHPAASPSHHNSRVELPAQGRSDRPCHPPQSCSCRPHPCCMGTSVCPGGCAAGVQGADEVHDSGGTSLDQVASVCCPTPDTFACFLAARGRLKSKSQTGAACLRRQLVCILGRSTV